MSMPWRSSASRALAAMCASTMHQVSLRFTLLHLSRTLLRPSQPSPFLMTSLMTPCLEMHAVPSHT